MNLMVVKRFIRNSVSRVEVVVFRVRGGWENVYVMSSPKYSNNEKYFSVYTTLWVRILGYPIPWGICTSSRVCIQVGYFPPHEGLFMYSTAIPDTVIRFILIWFLFMSTPPPPHTHTH